MKKRLLQLSIFLFLASTSHAYYQAEQGRWLNRDPIEEQGGVNVYSTSLNDPVNRIDPYGLISGSGEGGEDSVEGASCSLIVRIAHLFSGDDGTSNWNHINSGKNNGSTCYVGCGMNVLNELQGGIFPESNIPIEPNPPRSPAPPSGVWMPEENWSSSSGTGYDSLTEGEKGIAEENGWNMDSIDAYETSQLDALIDHALNAARSEAKNRLKPPDCCDSVLITVECQQGQSFSTHSMCGHSETVE